MVALALALASGSVACAVLVGLEDKQAYDEPADAVADAASSPQDALAATDATTDAEAGPVAIGPAEVFASAQAKPWGIRR